MGWRYRKSVKILPGVKVNFGLHSTSLTLGGKFARRTYSSTGRVTNSFSIPGTGLTYVDSSGGRNSRNAATQNRRPFIDGLSQTASHSRENSANQLSLTADAERPVNREDLRNQIHAIYRRADMPIDWRKVLIDDEVISEYGNIDYLKSKADDILNGNLDTYLEVISDINPFDDLLQYGSEFDCGTDDPRMMAVRFQVNGDVVLGDARTFPVAQYNELLQDYVCGCAIRVARDMLALLPLRHVIVDANEKGREILSVDFTKGALNELDFATIDASDTIQRFDYRMNFDMQSGFSEITPIDDEL